MYSRLGFVNDGLRIYATDDLFSVRFPHAQPFFSCSIGLLLWFRFRLWSAILASRARVERRRRLRNNPFALLPLFAVFGLRCECVTLTLS